MTTPARDNGGKFTRTLRGAERDAEACRLRARGYSYHAIAEQLGFGKQIERLPKRADCAA